MLLGDHQAARWNRLIVSRPMNAASHSQPPTPSGVRPEPSSDELTSSSSDPSARPLEGDMPSRTDHLHERLRSALRDDLNATWDDALATWTDATPAERKAVHAYVAGLRNRILRGLVELDAPEEIRQCIAVQCIEMKCHWTMLNTRIQNQMAQEGGPDETLLYRATCVSQIVQALEAFLPQDRVDRLSDLVAEPLDPDWL